MNFYHQLKSWMERKVYHTLHQHKLAFWYEPYSFDLPPLHPHTSGITYTPDFLLRELSIDRKQVILEPHGPTLGFTRLIRFREAYGNLYYVILITRNDAIPQIPAKSYDDIWPIEHIDLLGAHLHKQRAR